MRSYDNIENMHTILDQHDNPNLSETDRKLLNSLHEFVKQIQVFSEMYNSEYSCEKVETMLENLTNDPILFMGYIGVELNKLQDCDFEIKKDFVQAIKSLIDEYSIRKPKEKPQELL